MSQFKMMAAGLLVLGTGVLGLPQMTRNQKHIDNTPATVAVAPATMEASVTETTEDYMKRNLLARTVDCSQGKFTLGFDDVTIPAEERLAYSQLPHKMTDGFYWSAGFVPRPAHPGAGPAISPPNIMSYQPDLSKLTKDSRAEMATLDEQRFHVYGLYLGCQDDRITEDDCHMTLFGLRDGKEVAKKDFEHIPSCGKVCELKHFEVGDQFRNLTTLQFRAKDDGKPRSFAMDNLELEFAKDDCQAAALQIAAGQPIPTSIVEPTASPLVTKVTMVTVTYKPTITRTQTSTVTPVVFVPSYTPTTTITIPETLLQSATVLAKTTTMTVDGAVETLVCEANTINARDGSACSGALQRRDSGSCVPSPITMTFETPDETENDICYEGWNVVPASTTPFNNVASQHFLRFVPGTSDPEDANATFEPAASESPFKATSVFLGCTHPDKDNDCNVIAEGYVSGGDTVKEEFTIPACTVGQGKACELQYHHFPESFSGLSRLELRVKDSGKAQTFWLDNFSILPQSCY